MTFIQREALPTSLIAAYDKAAKGIENDETRTNGQNDERKIDSEKELLIFKQEVRNLAATGLDKMTYDAINSEIDRVMSLIEDDKKRITIVKSYNKLVQKRDSLQSELNNLLDNMSIVQRIVTLDGHIFNEEADNLRKQIVECENELSSKYDYFGAKCMESFVSKCFYTQPEPEMQNYW